MATWRKAVILLMIMVLITGLGILLFPFLNGWIVDCTLRKDAERFLQSIADRPVQPSGTKPEQNAPIDTTKQETVYPELLEAMQNYNQKIWLERQAGLCDPWSYIQPSFALGDYDIADEVFGVISIPKLSLEMPIYLGATYEHMADGAAHLSQTSIPIGGNNTNTVIAGHRGWCGANYFRFITELELGDEIIITNLWESLHYTVVGTKTIAPNEINEILIQEDRELLTLLTCHPYASGGIQRYLVFCERNKMEDK